MRILVTRPEPDASALASEIRLLGHEPVLAPLLTFRPIDFDPALLHGAKAVIFTSGNGLRAIEKAGFLGAVLPLPVFCVGEATARKARALGFKEILAVAETGEALVADIASKARGLAPLLHITGQHQAFDIAAASMQLGLSIRTLSVYAMEALGAFDDWLIGEFQAGLIDGVALMSARTAGIYAALCAQHRISASARRPKYFCLSTAIACQLAPLEPQCVKIAAKPTKKALLSLLDQECKAPPPSGNHD